MRQPRPDREEVELLRELQLLQAREPLPDVEPPALVDQAVLNMARRQLPLQGPPIAGKLRFIAILSTASVALIAVGLSLVQTPPASDPALESFDNHTIELRSSSEPSALASPAAAPQSRAAPASAPAPAADAARSLDESQPIDFDAARKSASAGTEIENTQPSQSPAKESSAAGADSDRPGEMAERVYSDFPQSDLPAAEAWLDLISQLRAEGLQTEAVEQLRAWQTQYPELQLPDWATELLQTQP